jgi:hypothetical protein
VAKIRRVKKRGSEVKAQDVAPGAFMQQRSFYATGVHTLNWRSYKRRRFAE